MRQECAGKLTWCCRPRYVKPLVRNRVVRMEDHSGNMPRTRQWRRRRRIAKPRIIGERYTRSISYMVGVRGFQNVN